MNPKQQENSRAVIANIADYIVPGHGPIFKVTDAMKKKLLQNLVQAGVTNDSPIKTDP